MNEKEVTHRVESNGCHSCTSHYHNRTGYPEIRRDGKHWRLSRWVFEQEYGPVPRGMYVCHTCDNPSCINPEHLFLGTAKDNSHDMDAKGRRPTRKKFKLSFEERLEIKVRLLEGTRIIDLAYFYNVSKGLICRYKPDAAYWRLNNEDND